MDAAVWTHAKLVKLAETHFSSRVGPLEEAVDRMVRHHEAVWRTTSAGVFRPTPSMYAVALGWELEKRGPNCSVCHRTVQLPAGSPPSAPTDISLAMGPRLSIRNGGLNAPQNLLLGHLGCVPSI